MGDVLWCNTIMGGQNIEPLCAKHRFNALLNKKGRTKKQGTSIIFF